MADSVRTVPPATAWRVALNCLGRLACVYKDPTGTGHNHVDCVRDDEAYAADLQLRLMAAISADDDDLILGRLEEYRAALATGD